MHLGGHMKTAGGLDTAVGRARDIGATAMQIFTQSPRQWRHPELDPEVAERFRTSRARARIADVACHATYLINLGATDDTTYHRSVQALAATMRTASLIEADSVVVHLGSHLGRGLDAALHQIVPAVGIALGEAGDGPTWLLFEDTAGAGDTLGRTVEELAQVIDELGRPARTGVCLDTCHLWASGVDITDPGRVDALLDELDERIGLDRVRCLHVNDAAVGLGANRDRHAPVGSGQIGSGLAVMLGHPRIQHLPAVLETRGERSGEIDAGEMATLRRLHRNGVRRWARRRAGHA
ncbi:MAG: deoxyribonuclease IV [Gaiellales bacterium]